MNKILGFLSIILLFIGVVLTRPGKLENMVVSSRVKEDNFLLKEAEKLGKKEAISRDINHLIEQLNKGNTNPGLGTKSICRGIYELRGRNGGRVYYREIGKDQYEILGYSDKDSQEKVIKHLKELDL